MLAIPKSRITAYLISCLVIVVSGSLATFSILSDGLRERFLWSFSDVNVVSAAGTASLYLSYLVAGPLYDKYGSTVTLFTGMIVYSLGYLLMYLSYNRSIGTTAILTAILLSNLLNICNCICPPQFPYPYPYPTQRASQEKLVAENTTKEDESIQISQNPHILQ
ncbi:hypothetical protein HDV02_002522 [Globomyces sp. JEL0801]|nr:hypothetical protein HDV02_002522 [Globomyces sp. JEL0801]